MEKLDQRPDQVSEQEPISYEGRTTAEIALDIRKHLNSFRNDYERGIFRARDSKMIESNITEFGTSIDSPEKLLSQIDVIASTIDSYNEIIESLRPIDRKSGLFTFVHSQYVQLIKELGKQLKKISIQKIRNDSEGKGDVRKIYKLMSKLFANQNDSSDAELELAFEFLFDNEEGIVLKDKEIEDEMKNGNEECIPLGPALKDPDGIMRMAQVIQRRQSRKELEAINMPSGAFKHYQMSSIAGVDAQARKGKIVYGQEVFQRLMTSQYNIDGADVVSAWTSERELEIKNNLVQNLRTMNNLESTEPGLTAFLYNERGIRHFRRYSVDLLWHQKLEDEEQKPYGIMINPTEDHNGAFSINTSKWDKLSKDLGQRGYLFRIAECRDKGEVSRRLIEFDQKHGRDNKMDFAFIGGHGTATSIHFGGASRSEQLSITDLKRKRVQRTTQFFNDRPQIILISCETGADKGIAEQMWKELGKQVIAPKYTKVNISSIDVKWIDDRPNFEIEYNKLNATRIFG